MESMFAAMRSILQGGRVALRTDVQSGLLGVQHRHSGTAVKGLGFRV